MNYIRLSGKRFCLLLNTFLFFTLFSPLCAQTPRKEFSKETFSQYQWDSLSTLFGKEKQMSDEFEKQFLTALSFFPELAEIKIEFRFVHSNTSFSTRPTFIGLFQRRPKRKYIIFISDNCIPKLVPLLFVNLPYNAQIGVIGHEITHISYFHQKNFFGLVRIALGNLSNKFLDKFERKTDSLCISRGLGYQLLCWSSYIRKTMNRKNWTGSVNINKGPMLHEKYMNPETIEAKIRENAIYKEIN